MSRRSVSRFCAVATLAAGIGAGAVAGCTGTVPPREIAAPDISKITVFFPVDGVVRGRGGMGSFADDSITHVVVDARPTGTETILPIEQDGSFNFAIIALSDDVLEISGARDPEGRIRGEPAYVRVPPLASAPPKFVCCFPTTGGGERGTCTTEDQMRTTNTCADQRAGATPCETVRECRTLNREILDVETSRIQITAPDAEGKISVTGVIESPGALVRLENRGQRAIGGRDPKIRLAQISDTSGVFKFRSVNARGDDELVIQVLDLLGNKSPEAPMYVPDPPLKTADIVGAYPFERLDDGKVGKVAVRFHVAGEDGRGLCPQSNTDPILCFTGGLTHAHVMIDRVTIDGIESNMPPPRETPTSATLPNNRGTEGDPLSQTQMVVVVIDHNEEAADADPSPPRRFEAAKQFIRSLRKRDLVGVVTYGGPMGMTARTAAPIGENNGSQLAAIDGIAATNPEGLPDLFGAIKLAAEMLEAERQRRLPGNIVVIAMSDAMGNAIEAEAAFADALVMVQPKPDSGFRGYGVHIVGKRSTRPMEPGIPEPRMNMNGEIEGNIRLIESITGFSADGRFLGIEGLDALNESLGDTASFLSGAYVLLYDMWIPDRRGKSARIEIRATVSIPNPSGVGVDSATATYEGPITIDQADL